MQCCYSPNAKTYKTGCSQLIYFLTSTWLGCSTKSYSNRPTRQMIIQKAVANFNCLFSSFVSKRKTTKTKIRWVNGFYWILPEIACTAKPHTHSQCSYLTKLVKEIQLNTIVSSSICLSICLSVSSGSGPRKGVE